MSLTWRGDAALAQARAGGQAGVKAAADALLRASQARVPVETGALRGSGAVRASGLSAQVVYTAPHAAPVHEGTRRMAARPFLKGALAGTDALAQIASRLRF